MKYLLLFACLFCKHVSAQINPNLTAYYDAKNKVVKLKWQNTSQDITGYVVQRSSDNRKWSDIYTIRKADFNSSQIEKFTDKQTDRTNYYRLKLVIGNGVEFSRSIIVIIGETERSWIMYPVPVTDVLNLQYAGSEPIQGVIAVFIQNVRGQILNRLRLSSLSRNIQIPVSNLGKGIYDIRIVVSEKVIWNQRFVK